MTAKILKRLEAEDTTDLWNNICSRYILSEDFIENNKDRVNWYNICIYQKLSEEFIYKHFYSIWLMVISRTQKLSETFIEKNFSRLDIDYVCIYQKLSEDFVKSNIDRLELKFLIQNKSLKTYSKNLQLEILERIFHQIDSYNEKYLTKYMKKMYDSYKIML